MSALDSTFQALGDPTRRRIFEQLVRRPRSVSELAAPMSMSLAAIGHHLRALESSGLVRSRKIGRVRTCYAEPAAMKDIELWVAGRRSDWTRRLGRLQRFLAETGESERTGGDDLQKPKRRDLE